MSWQGKQYSRGSNFPTKMRNNLNILENHLVLVFTFPLHYKIAGTTLGKQYKSQSSSRGSIKVNYRPMIYTHEQI